MKTLGLISLFALGLFSRGWRFMDFFGGAIYSWQRLTSESGVICPSCDWSLLLESEQKFKATYSLTHMSKWFLNSVGLISFPDVVPFNFLTNGE